MGKITTHPTPNPNSLKITRAERFIEEGMESFATSLEAEGHALGEPLFRIPGVINVFILPDFLTVTKDPAARWDDVLPGVKEVLEG
ncbi:MAG: NifU N-terminal domain-containing protein [Rhodothermales bacterium]|nr:NifU N-terminal domain-containing protein [Rhodothermales bacterium]MBO6781437.1 NifU N-terminal domain-containing protein [Rhodothermales bacterium]